MRRIVRLQIVSTALIVAGITMLALVAVYYGYGAYAQAQLQSMEAGEIPTVAPRNTPPVQEPSSLLPITTPIAEPTPGPMPSATRVVIPEIAVDAKVVELGVKMDKGELVWETPDHAVGHHLGTANPGEAGNMVLSGHISSPLRNEGNVFSRLPDISIGSHVVVYAGDAEYVYEVKGKRVVLPTEISVMDPTPDQTLTLITCVPDWVYTHRLIVIAKPKG